MLALKSMRPSSYFYPEPKPTAKELPSEILDMIARYLFDDGLGQLDSLLPFASVSHHFRQSALPLLYSTVSHVVRDRLDQGEGGLLRRLINHAHLLCHVRTLHLRRPVDVKGFIPPQNPNDADALTRTHQALDLQVIHHSLPAMPRLQQIRYAIRINEHRSSLPAR